MEPLSVLLVDDDAEFGTMMKFRLSKEAPHISFHFVESGDECLEYLKDRAVDCILSDFQMPGMGGMELLCTVKERGMDVPFIFLTGQGNEEVARDAFKNGADDYFTKDFGFAHFARITNSVEQAVKKRRAEHMKRRAEKDWEETFDAMDDIVTLQTTDFTIKRGNKAACKALSLEGEDIVGKKCYEIFHGTEQPIPECPALELITGKAKVVTHELTLGHRTFEVKVCPIMTGESFDSFVHIAKDITDRKKVETDLLHEKNFTDAIVNSMPGMFYLVDDRGRLVRWNAKYAEALGKKPEEMKGMNALETLAEESRGTAFSRLRQVLVNHTDCLDELVGVDKDGKKIPYLCSGSPVVMDGRTYLVGMAIDMTERKEAEKAIEQLSDMLNTIMDNVEFGMMVVGRDRTIRMANRSALGLMGYDDQSEIVGKTCHKLVCPSGPGECPVMDLGMRMEMSECAILGKRGGSTTVLKSAIPIKLGEEKVLLETFFKIPDWKLARKTQ